MTKDIPKTYDPSQVEDRLYREWYDKGYYYSKPNPKKQAFTVVIPPPNVTGVLHMGHVLNNTVQDALVRRARMQGFETCWVPGTDHASIATEAKVVAQLAENGIKKSELSRNEFLKHAWDWTDKYGGIILSQLKKMGCSCDWKRTAFTLDKVRSDAVLKVFVELYNKGLIYRGYRMVNWDPVGRTALSDEEVIYKDTDAKLYFVKYPLANSPNNFLTVATTRPETIWADVAVAVNPNDERFAHLVGQFVVVPMTDRQIPIIADDYVDIEFGTGCLKVTPAHDVNDYQIGLRHNLPIIDLLNDDGSLATSAGKYAGLDRFKARKVFADDLESEGFLIKIDTYKGTVGHSERTNAVVEPRLSKQWFVNMQELAKPALKVVEDGKVKLHPEKFFNTYKSWMEGIRDWCISRQLWWGHQIPAYYLPDGSIVVALSKAEALNKAKALTGNKKLTEQDLAQDPDVLDTWFSSWLWPISVFDGIDNPENPEFKYYYPTADLVTAPEILFFWVARMVMAGLEFAGEVPFRNVYLTGIVRDKLRRKMSKSLGNSPDPLDLIAQYSADGVRAGMLFSSPAGNDLLFDEKMVEQGRNFCNKLWNAFRLVAGWETSEQTKATDADNFALNWFNQNLNQKATEINKLMDQYRISEAFVTAYKLAWDDFCSWYLEMIKPEFGSPIAHSIFEKTVFFFDQILKLLHPFMPFITEEIYKNLVDGRENSTITFETYPTGNLDTDAKILAEAQLTFEMVTAIRNQRNKLGLSPKTEIELAIENNEFDIEKGAMGIIVKLAGISQYHIGTNLEGATVSFVVADYRLQIPAPQKQNSADELAELNKELAYTEGFLTSVRKKLSNERFVSSAPDAVVDAERKKEADALAKIEALKNAIAQLK